MNNLSLVFLSLLWFIFGSGVTFIALLGYFASNIVSLDYFSLFTLCFLLTHSFYGFFGTVYMFVCTLILGLSYLMYQYDKSIKATELFEYLQTYPSLASVFSTLVVYKNTYAELFVSKTGINAEHVQKFTDLVAKLSTIVNTFSKIIYENLVLFKSVTRNLKGFKVIYDFIDFLHEFNSTKTQSLNSQHTDKLNSSNPFMFNGTENEQMSYEEFEKAMMNFQKDFQTLLLNPDNNLTNQIINPTNQNTNLDSQKLD